MAKFNKPSDQDNVGQTPWEQYQNRYNKQQQAKKKKIFGKWHLNFNPHFNFKFNAAWGKFIGIMFCLTLFLMFLIYLISPLSRITTKSIQGTTNISTDDLSSSIAIDRGDSVLHTLSDRKAIISRFLKANPQLKTAKISIRDWNHAVVNVQEYGVAGYLYSKNRYYIVVDNGEIIDKYLPSPSSNEPIFVNFKPNNNLKSVTVQYHQLSKSIRKNIVKIIKSPTDYDPNRLKIEMHDKNVVFARSDTFASKMSYYPSIVSKIKKPSIINLEVGAYSYPIKSKK
ncbi:cell division protein FtsQ/DivIB [Lactobacillaceae bacterium Melli_B3]